MRTIDQSFAQAREEGRAALIPYITAGYPDLEKLAGLVGALTRAGADIIEIGIPFSDPLADGPVLQKAASQALSQGTRLSSIFEVVRSISRQAPPLVFLTYINPVFRFGIERFMASAREAGVQGLIIPDLPWTEGASLRTAARAQKLALIPLVAPTSTPAHLHAIRNAKGFVYGVSVTGVTGAREVLDAGVERLVRRVKAAVSLPLAIGFGIATPMQAQQVGRLADGVIVGSALVEEIGKEPRRAEENAFKFVTELRQALRNNTAKA